MIQWHPAPPDFAFVTNSSAAWEMHQHAPTYPPHCGCRCEPLPLIIDIDLLIPTQHSLFASPRDWSCVSLFQIYMFPQRNQWRTIVSAMVKCDGNCDLAEAAQPVDPPTPPMSKYDQVEYVEWVTALSICMSYQWSCSERDPWHLTFHDIPGIHDQIIHWVHGSDVFRRSQCLHCIGLLRATIHHLRRTGHIPYHNCARGLIQCPSAPVPSSKMETSNHLFRGRKLEKPWTFRCHVAILVYYGNPSILRLIGRWYLWGPWCLIQQLREFLLALCMPWETENPLLWWRTTGLEQTPTWEMTR